MGFREVVVLFTGLVVGRVLLSVSTQCFKEHDSVSILFEGIGPQDDV